MNRSAPYLLTLLLVFGLMTAPGLAGDRHILVSNEYMPYVDTSTKQKGVLTEIILAAFAAVDVKVEIQFRPWRRCALMVEQGDVLGAFPYGITKKRQQYAWFSDSMWTCRNVFFFLKGRYGAYDFTGLEDMQCMVIAGTSGHYYEEIFKEAGLTIDYAPGEASGLWKLWEMRNDMFAEDELVGWSLIRRIFPQFMHMFGATPTPWNVNPQTLMVSKKYPGAKELLAKFNQGLRIIRENGTYEAIRNTYMPTTDK